MRPQIKPQRMAGGRAQATQDAMSSSRKYLESLTPEQRAMLARRDDLVRQQARKKAADRAVTTRRADEVRKFGTMSMPGRSTTRSESRPKPARARRPGRW